AGVPRAPGGRGCGRFGADHRGRAERVNAGRGAGRRSGGASGERPVRAADRVAELTHPRFGGHAGGVGGSLVPRVVFSGDVWGGAVAGGAVGWLARGDLARPARAYLVVLLAILPPFAVAQASLVEREGAGLPRVPIYLSSLVSLWFLGLLALGAGVWSGF